MWRGCSVSAENGWKSVLLRTVNRINPNLLRLKRLIPNDLRRCYSVVTITSRATVDMAAGLEFGISPDLLNHVNHVY